MAIEDRWYYRAPNGSVCHNCGEWGLNWNDGRLFDSDRKKHSCVKPKREPVDWDYDGEY